MGTRPNRRRDAIALLIGMLIGGGGGEVVDRMGGPPEPEQWATAGWVSAEAEPAPTLLDEALDLAEEISELEPGARVADGVISAQRSANGERLRICKEQENGTSRCVHAAWDEL